jgi:SAM-dependent MidA family methyltransferase
LRASAAELPDRTIGVILANELLDALPVHLVTRTPAGLREVYVAERDGVLAETIGPLSDDAIGNHLRALDVDVEIGARAEVGLRAVDWMRAAARSLERGFILLIDYGHHARELFSPSHANATLTSYRAHRTSGDWLADPGERDLTAHVNLTAVERTAAAMGLDTLGIVDQTYFLTALGLTDRLRDGTDRAALSRRLAAKTLAMPGGLGSTMKVMVFSRGVGHPALAGLLSGRLT